MLSQGQVRATEEDESKAVGCLQSFFNEKLVEQFQEIKEKSQFVNFSIAHNILSPLTIECMLNERHIIWA